MGSHSHAMPLIRLGGYERKSAMFSSLNPNAYRFHDDIHLRISLSFGVLRLCPISPMSGPGYLRGEASADSALYALSILTSQKRWVANQPAASNIGYLSAHVQNIVAGTIPYSHWITLIAMVVRSESLPDLGIPDSKHVSLVSLWSMMKTTPFKWFWVWEHTSFKTLHNMLCDLSKAWYYCIAS